MDNHVFLSQCSADVVHLSSCDLSKCGNVTEAELIMPQAGIRVISATQLSGFEGQTLMITQKILPISKVMPRPGHTGCKVASFAGRRTRHKLSNRRGNKSFVWQNYHCCRITDHASVNICTCFVTFLYKN